MKSFKWRLSLSGMASGTSSGRNSLSCQYTWSLLDKMLWRQPQMEPRQWSGMQTLTLHTMPTTRQSCKISFLWNVVRLILTPSSRFTSRQTAKRCSLESVARAARAKLRTDQLLPRMVVSMFRQSATTAKLQYNHSSPKLTRGLLRVDSKRLLTGKSLFIWNRLIALPQELTTSKR